MTDRGLRAFGVLIEIGLQPKFCESTAADNPATGCRWFSCCLYTTDWPVPSSPGRGNGCPQ